MVLLIVAVVYQAQSIQITPAQKGGLHHPCNPHHLRLAFLYLYNRDLWDYLQQQLWLELLRYLLEHHWHHDYFLKCLWSDHFCLCSVLADLIHRQTKRQKRRLEECFALRLCECRRHLESCTFTECWLTRSGAWRHSRVACQIHFLLQWQLIIPVDNCQPGWIPTRISVQWLQFQTTSNKPWSWWRVTWGRVLRAPNIYCLSSRLGLINGLRP